MSQYVTERIKRLQREMNVLLMLQECASNSKKTHKSQEDSDVSDSSRKRRPNRKIYNIPKNKKSDTKQIDSVPVCTPHVDKVFTTDTDETVNSLMNYGVEKVFPGSELEVYFHTKNPIVASKKYTHFDRKRVDSDKNTSHRNRKTRSISATAKNSLQKDKGKNFYELNTHFECSENKNIQEIKEEPNKCFKIPKVKKFDYKHQKFLEESMSNTSKTIDMLQVQVKCSNANLQLLTAGRDFLAQTLQLLQIKYLQLRSVTTQQKQENEVLKNENKELVERLAVVEEFQNKIVKYEEINDKMKEDNEQYETIIRELNTEREQFLKLIDKQTKDIDRLTEENQCLQTKVCEGTDKSIDHIYNCETKIVKLIKLQECSKNETARLRTIINSLQSKKIHENWKCLRNEVQRLREQNTCLQEQLKLMKNQDEAKCKKIELELMSFMEAIMRNEQIVSNERNNMLQLVEKLSRLIEMHKNRIQQLMQINKQQEKLLISQSSLLKRKEEELLMAEETNNAIKKRALVLENQVQQLYTAMENLQFMQQLSLIDASCKNCNETTTLKETLIKTRSELEKEREQLLIKEKIIDDQADSIKTLKITNLECVRNSESEQNIYYQLQTERHLKRKLLSEIEDLEWQKDLLLQEIKDLKRQDGNSVEIKNKLKEQYRILSLLEEQVAIKQEEWQNDIEHINQEKSQAINVARFATQKLIETIQDFQKQNENQQDFRSKVLEVIHRNDEYNSEEKTELRALE